MPEPDEGMTRRNRAGGSSWAIRRYFMFAVAAFCMITVWYVLYRDLTSGPADTAVTMSFVTLIGLVGSYVFNATWEDISLAKIKGGASRIITPPASSKRQQPIIEDQP